MIAMVIETHAGRRLIGRAQGHQQLELQKLLDLTRRDEARGTAEERIARRGDAMRQAEPVGDVVGALEPAGAKIDDFSGRTHAHIFAHPEGLQPVDLKACLAAKTIGLDVEFEAAGWYRSARGGMGIKRIAGGRREHEVARTQCVRPILAGLASPDRRMNLRLLAVKAAYAAEEMREAHEIA